MLLYITALFSLALWVHILGTWLETDQHIWNIHHEINVHTITIHKCICSIISRVSDTCQSLSITLLRTFVSKSSIRQCCVKGTWSFFFLLRWDTGVDVACLWQKRNQRSNEKVYSTGWCWCTYMMDVDTFIVHNMHSIILVRFVLMMMLIAVRVLFEVLRKKNKWLIETGSWEWKLPGLCHSSSLTLNELELSDMLVEFYCNRLGVCKQSWMLLRFWLKERM